MVILTRHGSKKMKKRQGIPKMARQRIADKALQEGLSPECTDGVLLNYLKKKQHVQDKKHSNSIFKILGEFVYVFTFDACGNPYLLTSYLLPSEYRRSAIKLQKEFRQ